MKQTIGIGQVVDDGTGDYLRRGGQKTNDNFTELYNKLGDGQIPFPAGAWKTFSGTSISPVFGEAWALNTTNNVINVNLPKGGVADYNKVIRLRDVWSRWATNNVRVFPATGDTMKGSPSAVSFYKNFMDVELVYCSPGRWEYVENKQVDKITTSDLSSVAKIAYIATQGQTDFPNVFGVGNDYNAGSLDVYYRGNLYYIENDPVFNAANSNYGSIGATPGQLVDLDGKSIRLKTPCNAGDIVQFVTYLDGLATWRSSYESHTMRVYQTGYTSQPTVPGEIWVGNLATKRVFTVEEFGINPRILINPNAVELSINGIGQVKSGDADMPAFTCEGAEGRTEGECLANSGTWVESGQDFSLVFNSNSVVTGIRIGSPLDNGDVVCVKWFNNDIGTLMQWDGVDGIKEHADKVYLNNEQEIQRTNLIEYSDYNNPTQKSVVHLPDASPGRINNVQDFFDVIYPIGTIYENAHNQANPGTYMGIGRWSRYAEGMFIAGWSSIATDPDFALNNNDLDSSGQPSLTAGGTGGGRGTEIKAINVPQLKTTDKVLIKDDNGAIIVGGCQLDPDAEGPGYTKYREDTVAVNKGITTADRIATIPPYITANRWIRVA